MERFWRGVGFHLGKRWYAVLAVMLAGTALAAVGLQRLEFATGQDSYLDPSSQAAVDNVAFQDAFGGEAVVLLFQMTDGATVSDLFSPENITRFEQMESDLRAIPEVVAVITPLTSLRWSEAIAAGPGTTALTSALARDPDPASAALRQADLEISLARLGEVGERSLTDETWLDFLLFDNTGYRRGDTGVLAPPDDERVIRESLLSTFPNQQVAVGGVVLAGNASLDELSAGTDAVTAVMEQVRLDGVDLVTTGTPVYLREINDYLQTGMLTLGALALAVMAVILLVMFSVRWRLLPLLAVALGVVWAFGVIGFLGIDLSLVTISGLPILIGMGIDFAIQVHNRVEEEVVLDKEAHPISETVANVAPALIASVIGAAVAFLALRISRVPMIRDFGVLLTIGIIVLVAIGIVVPTTVLGAREWHRRTARRSESVTERVIVWLGSMPTRFVPALAVVGVVLVALGVSMESRTQIQSDPIKWIDQDSQVVADVQLLEQQTGFETTLGILVEANNVLAPEVSDLLTGFVADAEQRLDVVSTSSLVGTMAKVIAVPGATALAPTSEDLQAALAVAPADIARSLVADGGTAAQVNLRLGPASLEERAVVVEQLEADLAARLAAVTLADDSVLDDGLQPGQAPIRAVPAGLAVVGVSLLENLTANRAELTYVALAAAALWLLVRFRSLTRTLLTLVPVTLAVGVSALLVSVLGIELSPLTTVSGPLVIATCVEFAVLITARYLEERKNGLAPRLATDRASARTGRAFFTSGFTTVGGFAVLMFSPLPLLRDFGAIVSLNVLIALLAALTVMPPLLVAADERQWMGVPIGTPARSVRLAAPLAGVQGAVTGVAAVVIAGVLAVLVAGAQVDQASATTTEYASVALPTTTTTTTTTIATDSEVPIDPADFGTERPTGLIAGTLFDLLTAGGVAPNQAVCTAETLLSRTTEDALIAAGIATFSDEALEPVIAAAQDCQIPDATIDAIVTSARG